MAVPILAAIPELWPDGVLDETDPPSRCLTQWVALRVQPRCEKAVARVLMRDDFAYFLCLRSVTRVYQRRRVISQVPLFPGYVFASGENQELLEQLWQVRHVSCVLTPPDPAKFLRELTSLRRILSAGVPVTPEEQLQPGQRARIIRGCFEGLEGTVLINRSGLRLMIAVGLLGRGASIEVTPDMVERL